MERNNSSKKIRNIILKVNDIYTMPEVYYKVSELLDHPRSCSSDFTKAISGDQALAVKLLKIVNSAFYGFDRKIEKISEAVTIIGFNQLRELVLSASVLKMFKDIKDINSDYAENFWKHSVACGIGCRCLAICMRKKNPESFFVTGLLHDIGCLILMRMATNQYIEILKRVNLNQELLYDVEKDILGFTHEDVGNELLKLWKLPGTLISGVGFHHSPRGNIAYAIYADIAHVADIITHACELGVHGENLVPPLNADAWDRLTLKKEVLVPTINKIQEHYASTISFFLD